MISREEFNQDFTLLCTTLEQRRKRYVAFFYGCVLLVGFLLLVGIGNVNPMLMLLGCLTWILIPIYCYRGTNGSAGLAPSLIKRFSLKDDIYSMLFKLFGPIEFAPRGGVSLAEVHKSTLVSRDHKLYMAEDYVTGQMNAVQVYLCEAEIAQVVERRRVAQFKGLLLVCDISDVKVKLRKGFDGRTLVVNAGKRDSAAIIANTENMHKFPLPEKFQPALEAYTTAPSEATKIITPSLLEQLTDFSLYLETLSKQVVHWDNKVAYAASALYEFSKEWLLNKLGRSELPSESEYNAKMRTGLDLSKADPASNAQANRNVEVEFYEDKFIVTIPCKYDLFEPNSLFEPALNDEDGKLLYNLMQLLDNITLHLSQVEP